MRTLTDVTHTIKQVEVELTAQELAARLGYTGLDVVKLSLNNGCVNVHLYSTPPLQEYLDNEESTLA